MGNPKLLDLTARLLEAADWLADDIPSGVVAPQFLEGDVRLDELDAYCVEIMREAAEALSNHHPRARR
jgi:hypothetical protein